MKQQKGFSLIEVLVSLALVSTVALTLVEQQSQTKQLLTHLVIRTEASQFLDSVDESDLISSKKENTSLLHPNPKIKLRSYGHLR